MTEQSLFDDGTIDEIREFAKGSALIALESEPAFDRYVFIEKDASRANELRALASRFADKRVTILCEDADSALRQWCATIDRSRDRAVVFLDPYGMRVDWSLLQVLAATHVVDLWLLFPLGMGVNRLLTRGGLPPKEWSDALDRVLGTTDWRQAFYSREVQATLFGDEVVEVKRTDFDGIARFFVKRLGTIFVGVADNPLPLFNRRGCPLYLLCFAASNDKGAKPALRIAQDVLKA